MALGASGTIKAAQEVLVAMGEKDGFITPERLEMLVNELLKHKTSTRSVCPVSQKTVKRSLRLGWRSSAVCLTRWPSKNFVCPMARCAKVSCTRWKAASATGIFVAARHRVWQISTTSIANRRAGYWKLPPRCWSSGRSRILLANPHLAALLKWAVMLHEVGLNINHSGMHRHSAYILQNSDLPGFNQEQQMLMATLVRYHRKAIKLDDLPRFTLFRKKQFLPLIQLLRPGVLLNNQRQATTTPPTLRLQTEAHHWTLTFPHNWFSQNALVLLDLEKSNSTGKACRNGC